MTFKIGDIVIEGNGTYVGVVCTEGEEHEGRETWKVFWHDGDITRYEDGESMCHHKIETYQWNTKLYKKYMDIICPRQDSREAIG